MKVVQMSWPAALVTCAWLVLPGASSASAQSKPSARDSVSAKVGPEPPAPPKVGEQAEHSALSRAHQSGINQGQAVVRYAENNAKALDKSVLNRYTESLGRALDDAQEHRQVLEKSVPQGGAASAAYQTTRDHEQAAAEYYRAFVLEVSKTKPNAVLLKDEAKSLIEELKDAEAAHRKTFPGPDADVQTDQGQVAPRAPAGGTYPSL